MNRVIGVAAAAGCAALVIAGCGTTHATSGSPSGARSPSSSASPAAATTPQSRAAADAASILASFVPPPGAVRLTAAPATDNGALRRPALVPQSPNLVDDVTWWRFAGSPASLLAWEKAHLSKSFTLSGSGAGGTPAILSQQFALPPVAGVLTQRELAVETVSTGGGQSAVRVDAQVQWLPAKPASERIPATAKAVTITAIPGLMVNAKVPAPVTDTNAATVGRIASLVDGLAVFPPGIRSCPADVDRAVKMTFRATASGPPLAVVTANVSGCRGVGVTVGGKLQPSLAGGETLAQQSLAIAGLHWTGYDGGHVPSSDINPGGVMQRG